MRIRIAAIAAALSVSLPTLAGSSSAAPAPTFTLASRAGQDVSLAQYKGQVVMLNFWASWCGPCRQEMPLLESIYKKDSKVSKLYDVAGMPSTVIIDRNGKLRVLHRGYKPGDENEYLDSIRTLIRE